MAEDQSDPRESWQVPFRIPAVVAVTIPVFLLFAVVGLGTWYNSSLRNHMYEPPVEFPQPGLETGMTAATTDPEAPAPVARPDPAIVRAEAQILKHGIAGWPRAER